jgi:hypothetical protein
MRFQEFTPLILIEQDVSRVNDLSIPRAMNELDAIIHASSQLPPEAAGIKTKITSNLLSVKNTIGSIIEKLISSGQAQLPVAEPTPVEQPAPAAPTPVEPAPVEPAPTGEEEQPLGEAIQGDVEYDSLAMVCEELKQEIVNIQAMKLPEATKKKLVATIQKSLDTNLKLLGKYSNVVDELKVSNAKLKAAEEFVNNVNDLLVTLGNKVQGYVEVSPEEYTGLSAKAKKAIDNARQFTTTFRQALFGMVLDISKQNQTIDKLSIQNFLQACVSGDVLDMLSLTGVDRGNVRDHVKQEYQPMIDFFAAQKVFSWSPGKTSGAIGPGEMALCMMGSPTEKAKDKGDLIVGGADYEIKAGSTSGGRLNSKKILKGPSAWPVWTKGIEHIVTHGAPNSAVWTRTSAKGVESTVKRTSFSANTFNKNKTTGKVKQASAYNFNYRGLTKLNDEVLIYSEYQLTYNLFMNTFKALITNLDDVQKSTKNSAGKRVLGVSPEKLLSSAIYEDGTIDVTEMMSAYTRLAYESYNRADGVEAILFLNTSTLDYTIIRNGTDLVSKLNNEVTITGGFNFNDDQQSATPAYLARKA